MIAKNQTQNRLFTLLPSSTAWRQAGGITPIHSLRDTDSFTLRLQLFIQNGIHTPLQQDNRPTPAILSSEIENAIFNQKCDSIEKIEHFFGISLNDVTDDDLASYIETRNFNLATLQIVQQLRAQKYIEDDFVTMTATGKLFYDTVEKITRSQYRAEIEEYLHSLCRKALERLCSEIEEIYECSIMDKDTLPEDDVFWELLTQDRERVEQLSSFHRLFFGSILYTDISDKYENEESFQLVLDEMLYTITQSQSITLSQYHKGPEIPGQWWTTGEEPWTSCLERSGYDVSPILQHFETYYLQRLSA